MRIDFLHQNIYGIGGTVRSVVNLANALSASHNVRIVSVFRRVDEPKLRISPNVELVPLIDVRAGGPDSGHRLHNERSQEVPPAEELFNQYSRLTDMRVREYLDSTKADVVVGTRPGLNLMIARTESPKFVSVVQEHTTITKLDSSVIHAMKSVYSKVDLVTTVSSADRDRVIESVGVPQDKVAVLPNGVPRPASIRSEVVSRTIVAAGRFSEQKRYDVLIRAFALAVEHYPGWRLRLYGNGHLESALKSLADSLGVSGSVDFMGPSTNMEEEWAKGELSVCSSDYESFGMTIIESLRCGVPVVSTACPDGPVELLESGRGGLLVKTGDPEALAEGLKSLLGDPDELRRLSALGLEFGEEFDPSRVAATFEELISAHRPKTRRNGRPRNWLSSSWRLVGAPRTRRRGSASTAARPAAGVRSISGSVVELHFDHPPTGDLILVGQGGRRVRIDAQPGNAPIAIDSSTLGEGIWNLRVQSPVGNRSDGVRPLWIDSHRANLYRPSGDHTSFARVVPYTTVAGVVGLRIWNRTTHLEVTGVRRVGSVFEVDFQAVGDTTVLMDATIEAQRLSGVGEFRLGTLDMQDSKGTVTVDADILVAHRLTRQEAWRLCAVAEGQNIRFATLESDVPDLRRVRLLPSFTVGEPLHSAASYGVDTQEIEVSARYGRENCIEFTTREVQ